MGVNNLSLGHVRNLVPGVEQPGAQQHILVRRHRRREPADGVEAGPAHSRRGVREKEGPQGSALYPRNVA